MVDSPGYRVSTLYLQELMLEVGKDLGRAVPGRCQREPFSPCLTGSRCAPNRSSPETFAMDLRPQVNLGTHTSPPENKQYTTASTLFLPVSWSMWALV